jgi:hypothetical protein
MQQELRRRLGKSVVGLEVIEEDDKVVIRGYAQNWHQKQVAQHVVMQHVTKPVINNIVVGRRRGAKTQIANASDKLRQVSGT